MMVFVEYGEKPRTDPLARRYAYRVPEGLKLKVGDLVEVPPTERTRFKGSNPLARVVELDAEYPGPTHEIVRKHRHRFITISFKRCKCGVLNHA